MDRILVFENGEIVEDGTHEELMRNAQVGGILPKKKDDLKISWNLKI